MDGEEEVINEEIEGKDHFDDLDYVSNIKLVNIKLGILTSQRSCLSEINKTRSENFLPKIKRERNF